jgi:hypothetical protein
MKYETNIPDHVIDIFKKKYENYPCLTQTRNVTEDAIKVLTKKNKILWYSKFFDGNNLSIKEAAIDYSNNYKIMIYCKSKEDEKVYSLIIMSSEVNYEHVEFLLKGLNKYYTIDLI